MQGVSISIFVRLPGQEVKKGEVFYSEIRGTRKKKYEFLSSNSFLSLNWKKLNIDAEYKFFVPKDFGERSVYDTYAPITDIFKFYSTGVGTGRDSVFVDFSAETLNERAKNIADKKKSNLEIFATYPLKDTASWNISNRRKVFKYSEAQVVKYSYRPFDTRWVIYDPLIRRDQRKVMANMLKPNLSIIVCQQNSSGKFNHAFCADKLSDESLVSNRTTERGFVFPSYLYSDLMGQEQQSLNLKSGFLNWFSSKYDVEVVADQLAGKGNIGISAIQGYIYACLHSEWLRETFSEFHKIDFPKIPFVASLSVFRKIADAGRDLMEVHLGTKKIESICSYTGKGDNTVGKCTFDAEKRTIWINETQGLAGVDKEVWDYKVGSYQVLEKWLKDRRGLELKLEDKKCLIQIVERISHSMRLTETINGLADANTLSSVFNFSVDSVQKPERVAAPVEKSGFERILELRLALACKIVDEMLGTKEFSRVKFAKAFYLADAVSDVNLKTEYTREAAGPLDQRALYNEKIGIEPLATRNEFFSAEKKKGKEFDFVQYTAGSKIHQGAKSFVDLFGAEAQKIINVIQLTSPMTRDQIEIVATLYACWNDFLIAKKKPSDRDLVKEFKDRWHPEKTKKFIRGKDRGPRFTEEKLIAAIAWMKSKELVPRGSGPKTKSKPAKDTYIPF